MSDQTEYELERTRRVVAESVAAQAEAADAAVAASVDLPETAWEDWTVDELKDELASRDLPVSGNKAELIARLEES